MGQLTRVQTVGIVALLAVVTGWVGLTVLHTGQPASAPGIVVREAHPASSSGSTTPGPSPSPPLSGVSGPERSGSVPSPPSDAAGTAAAELVVHVAGAVKKPGVYHLKPGARNIDAVYAAGGFTSAANPDAINLAAPSEDSSQIYIPTRVEQPSGGSPAHAVGSAASAAPFTSGVVPPRAVSAKSGAHSSHASGKFSDPSQGQVNLNTADAAQLQHIPGIGPAMAERILAYRRTAGRLQSPDELLQIPGIGDKKYQKMKPYMTVR